MSPGSSVETHDLDKNARNSTSSGSQPGERSSWSGDTVAERGPRATFPLRKRFTRTWTKKQHATEDDEAQDGLRGPLGLRVLHLSPEPLVDIIFVHGLRGGSVKTWRKGSDPRNFWPKLWLPLEPSMGNANIHSFGYESDWASTKSSILSVHDFGQSLLEEIRNSPFLRDGKSRPMLLVGHSMGGLVIKKAFILGKDVPGFHQRIRCIFFLATPHRGSDYAALLNNILAVSGILSPRPYVTDLVPASTSAQLINEDFGRYAQSLPVFSFYETLRMSIGVSSSLVVEKTSAVLGPAFQNERVQYLNANHRDVCKFENTDDPNYITLKNALAGATQDILKEVIRAKSAESKKQMILLKAYLSISDGIEESFHRATGSCEWIDSRDDFQEWRDSTEELLSDAEDASTPANDISIFWVSANPGTGKTFLASHVVDELIQFQLESASYFFHVGNKSSNVAHLLRSIAYQMANSNAAVRHKLLELYEEGLTFDKDDAPAVFAKVYKKGVLLAGKVTPQYWIIDALDECHRYQEFFSLLKGLGLHFPLRIFVTSRKIHDMQRIAQSLRSTATVTQIEIETKDSIQDIEHYIKSRTESLPMDLESNLSRDEFVRTLLQKSNACFLWVKYVLDELGEIYSSEGVDMTLDTIPEGMVPYYERMARSMSMKREKHIAKGVLMWVVASSRKLHTSELAQALQMDVKTILPSTKHAVEGLCGQLICVDDGTELVGVVHPTVREFLLSESAGEFQVHETQAHERIALTCLYLLCSAEMHPPRTQRQLLSRKSKDTQASALLDYALTQFSEHVYMASSETDQLLIALDRFLQTNVLSWAEAIASKGDIYPLIRTSKNLKAYLDRRAKYRSPLNMEVQNVGAWSTDLSQIATRFGSALLENPASIYFLTPPLCPSGSAIYQRFAKRPDGLTILGRAENAWDDCIASVSFDEDATPCTVSCGESLVAVGMDSGDVDLYDDRSCQRAGRLQAGEPVDMVHVTEKNVAVCTTRSISLMDRQGNILWTTRHRFGCIVLTSTPQQITLVSQHGHVMSWDIATGALLVDQAFAYRHPDDDGGTTKMLKAPHVASLSSDLEIVAMGFRAETVCMYDVASGDLICWARDERNRLVSTLLFNPNPDVDLLLVIFRDHELVLYETWTGDIVGSRQTPSEAGVLSATVSPDGRTLATMDTLGVLQIWDFESLGLIYRVSTPSIRFCMLNFTSDSSSVMDIVDEGMRLWSPPALVRKNIADDQSVSDNAAVIPAVEGEFEVRRGSTITALSAHHVLPMVFAGKRNGDVIAFSTKTGGQLAVLYNHGYRASILGLAVSQPGMLASSDDNGVVQVWKIGNEQLTALERRALVFKVDLTPPVRQILFSASGDYLLVASGTADMVYRTTDGSHLTTLPFTQEERKVWRWLESHQRKKDDQMLLISDNILMKFDLPLMTRSVIANLDYPAGLKMGSVDIRSGFFHHRAGTIVITSKTLAKLATSPSTFIFNMSIDKVVESPQSRGGALRYSNEAQNLGRGNDTTLHDGQGPTILTGSLIKDCKRFIGINERTNELVFLHRNSWVCTVSRDEVLFENRYTQHFFVPDEIISAMHDTPPAITQENSIVLCRHAELLVVKNGFNHGQARSFG